MRNMTITGSWRGRAQSPAGRITCEVPARYAKARYVRCPWIPEGLHTMADNLADAQFFMERIARVVRFMDATGLKPVGRGWEFKLKDIAPGLPMCADHPMLWIDDERRWIVTIEIYANAGDPIPMNLAHWADQNGWHMQIADPRSAMWNPHQGCQLMIVMAPARTGEGGDYRRVCDQSVQQAAGQLQLAV